jgi:hypothetical protein
MTDEAIRLQLMVAVASRPTDDYAVALQCIDDVGRVPRKQFDHGNSPVFNWHPTDCPRELLYAYCVPTAWWAHTIGSDYPTALAAYLALMEAFAEMSDSNRAAIVREVRWLKQLRATSR